MPLYEHQKQGLAFLARRWNLTRKQRDRGAILAFDMGLGKTLTALLFFKALHARGLVNSILVLCPPSILIQWRDQAEKFLGLKSCIFHGNRKKYNGAPLVLTTYETARTPAGLELIEQLEGYLLVCDEAHDKLSHYSSKRAVAVSYLEPVFTLLLTGTPICNVPDDLYSLVSLVDQKLVKSKPWWDRTFIKFRDIPIKLKRPYHNREGKLITTKTITVVAGYKNLQAMSLMLQSVMFRKTKKECLDLPKKTVLYKPYSLTTTKSKYTAYLSWLQSNFDPLRQLELEREFLSGIVQNGTEISFSTKRDKLSTLNSMLKENSEKKIIWCTRQASVDGLYEALKKSYTVYKYHGGCSTKHRQESLAEFKEAPEGAILIATIQSAGKGTDLPEATMAIFYEVHYQQSQNPQAEDRCHRLSSTKPVTIYYLYGEDTVEEKIMSMLHHKSDLNQGIIDGKITGDKEAARIFLAGKFNPP